MRTSAPGSAPSTSPSWRTDAVRIVEQLFPGTSTDAWNLLLDLRQLLSRGDDWNATLNTFLACRQRLEADHYLPFYRLRRLLSASLRLEVGADATSYPVRSLEDLLRGGHRSLAEIKRAVRRELFEHRLDMASPEKTALRLVERR